MVKTVRGLERGIQVLQALQAQPIAALHDIHVATKLPKATLLRILHTLEQSGLVMRRLGDGRYRMCTTLTRMVRKRDRYDRVAEAAAPVLDQLCQKISWASDLMVPAGDHMEIRETSRMRSPFLFGPDRIGTPVNWLLSGVGRAYLAFCPEEERQHILELMRKSTNPVNWLGRDAKRLNDVLAETRNRGYGTRDPAFGGGSYGTSIPDGLEAIAVPLLGRKRVHGAINIIWTKPAHTIDEMVARHLADLQMAAVEIVDSFMKRPTIRVQPQSRDGDQRRGQS